MRNAQWASGRCACVVNVMGRAASLFRAGRWCEAWARRKEYVKDENKAQNF